MFDKYITPIESNGYQDISNQLLNLINNDKSYTLDEQEDFGHQLLSFYQNVLNLALNS